MYDLTDREQAIKTQIKARRLDSPSMTIQELAEQVPTEEGGIATVNLMDDTGKLFVIVAGDLDTIVRLL